MKDKHDFEALYAELLTAERVDITARSSKLKRKRDAIAAIHSNGPQTPSKTIEERGFQLRRLEAKR